MDADLPAVDAVFMARDAGVTPDPAGERCHHMRKSRMTLQQDAGPYVTVGAQQLDAGALACGVRQAERLPCLHGVVCDQARHRRRHGLGERRLAHEGAYQFAVFGLEHELKFGNRATEDDVMSGPYAFARGGLALARMGMSSR